MGRAEGPAGGVPSADRPGDHRLGTDPRDIASLYVSHRHSLAVLAHRYLSNPFDVDEVVQEAFLRLVMSMPELETEAQAVAYARRTVTNLCVDRIRRSSRTPASTPLDDLTVELPAHDGELEDPILAAEDAAIVRSALARLAPSQRHALIAWEIEEKPIPQIAVELGIEESAVKHVLFRARRTLRRLLVGTSVDPEVDILELTAAEAWGIAGQRAARGAQRLGVLLLLLALPALAVVAMSRSNEPESTEIVAVPPATTGGGLLDPVQPPAAVPSPAAPTPVDGVSPDVVGPPASGAEPSSPDVPAAADPGPTRPPGPPSQSGPSAATSEVGEPSTSAGGSSGPAGTPSTASPGPSQSPPSSPTTGAADTSGSPVPRGFAVSGDLTSGDAGAVVVGNRPGESDGRPIVVSDLAFVANTRQGSLRVDVTVDATTPVVEVRAVPTLPIQGANLRFDPVTTTVSKQIVDDAGSLLVDITLGLSGAGRVLGPADGPGLAQKPSSVRLVLVLSPSFDRITSGRLTVSGVQQSAPAASPSPTGQLPAPSGPATAASPVASASSSAPVSPSTTSNPASSPASSPVSQAPSASRGAPTAPGSPAPDLTGQAETS